MWANVPAGILGLANALPRGAWDVNLQLLLKLLGNSLGAGLERLRVEGRLNKLEERLELAQGAANDGLWDFDIESNEVHFSPRWKADARLPGRRDARLARLAQPGPS